MIVRTSIAACCLVVAAAAPAGAQDGCTTELVGTVTGSLFSEGEPGNPYPLVERDPSGTVHVYPQNVVPYTVSTAGAVAALPFAYASLVVDWVECVG